MATQTPQRPPAMEPAQRDRSHVVYARHQWFSLALFGALSLLAALIFSRWDPGTTSSRWFWIIVGPMAGVVAMFKSQSLFGHEGADRDAGPYVGMLVGTTIAAIVIGSLSLQGWVLPGVFFVIAGFLAFMAWLEQSGVGMTTALTVTVLAATTAVMNLPGSVVNLSLTMGFMFLAASLALLVCRSNEIESSESIAPRPDVEGAVES